MNVLVTGGGGFLGQYIVEQLVARGDTVTSYSRSTYESLARLGVKQIAGDMRDRPSVMSAIRGNAAVIHTAAVASIWGPWEWFYGINTLGTRYVLEGCRQRGVSKLVYTSSPSVTFEGMDQRGIDESAPYPKTFLCHYPATKAIAEQEVLAASGKDGLSTCALRPHLIWGPRDQHLIPRLIARAKAGALRRVGAGQNRVDTIYVENAASAHLQALDRLSEQSPVAGRAYFLSQGEPVNCWEWIDQILAMAALSPVQRSISAKGAYLAGGALEAMWAVFGLDSEPRMTRFLAAQLATDHYFDLGRARADFGYAPKITMQEGMRRLGEWLVRQTLKKNPAH
jgi:nucleoside-diphosphate-sugar epimerase